MNQNNKKLKAIIIDNEPDAIEVLEHTIKRFCITKVTVVDTCESGKEAIESICKHKPDLIFLDIKMPGMTGFQMLEKLESEELNFEVIFVTAYPEYAMRAYDVCAIGYITKPIGNKALIKKVNHVYQLINPNNPTNPNFKKRYDILRSNENEKDLNKRLVVRSREGDEFIYFRDIEYCESDGNFTKIYLVNNQKMIRYCSILKNVHKMLGEEVFCRINNAYLINMFYLKKYKKGDGGMVTMKSDEELKVSRTYKKNLLEYLSKYKMT